MSSDGYPDNVFPIDGHRKVTEDQTAGLPACPPWCSWHSYEGSAPGFYMHNSKWIPVAADVFVRRVMASDIGSVFLLTDKPDSGNELQVSEASVDALMAVLKDPSWRTG